MLSREMFMVLIFYRIITHNYCVCDWDLVVKIIYYLQKPYNGTITKNTFYIYGLLDLEYVASKAKITNENWMKWNEGIFAYCELHPRGITGGTEKYHKNLNPLTF